MTSVLVVEDDESIRSFVCDALADEGYRVTGAEDGAQALGAVDADPPAVVLLDMHMPAASGWDFARNARDRGLGVTIIVMTAAANPKVVGEIGAVALLAKPFTLDALLAIVSLHTGGSAPPVN